MSKSPAQLQFSVDPELQHLFFPVKLITIHTDQYTTEDGSPFSKPIEDYLAVINIRTQEIYSVVTKNYHLLLNKDALEIGKETFEKLFPIVSKKDLIPFNVVSSRRKTFCHIDVVHKDVNFDVWEQETWFPFLRVTNSYNKTYAFTMEIGFVKSLTSSGIIFDKNTIQIKQSHSFSTASNVDVDISILLKTQSEFVNYMVNLKRFLIPSKYIFPLVLKALVIKYKAVEEYIPGNGKAYSTGLISQLYEIVEVRKMANSIFKVHSSPYGESAYSAFNTMIDLINSQGKTSVFKDYANTVRSLNERLSQWTKIFTEAIEKRDFNLETYLKAEIDLIKKVDSLDFQ